ncbi:hypothetical protein LCGC14_2050560, partial [marine sediment metagenome]
VYNMNDPGSRAKIKARQQVLNKQGIVKEQNMPDSKRDIRQQFMESQNKHIKNIGCR